MAPGVTTDTLSRRGMLRVLGGTAGVAVGGGLATTLISGCSNGLSDGLAVGLFAEPDSLDPATTRLIPAYQVISVIYDQLIWQVSDRPGEYLPGLASSWRLSRDGTAYTFTLRRDVTFHDGTRFDAHAVKYSFDRLVDPATQSVSAKGVLGPYKETQVLDDYTARVVFSTPNGGFLDNLASPLLAIVSPRAAGRFGSTFGHNPVGSGPFVFRSWVPGESLEVVRNDGYRWGPPHPGLRGPATARTVIFRVVASSPAQANALQTRGLDIAQGMAVPDIARLRKARFPYTVARASGMPFGFMLNVRKPPTDEIAVRQAIQYGTDTATINRTVFSNLYPTANTVLTSATFGHDSTSGFAYDPRRAAGLLDAAGWRVGAGGVREKNGRRLSLSWLLSTGFGFNDAAELMVAQLQKIGFESTITLQSSAEIGASIEQGVMNVSGIYDYAADPYILNTLFSCAQVGKGPNYAHFCSPAVDASIAAANENPYPNQRAAAYQRVQRTLMSEAMFVPIYDLSQVFVYTRSVTGLVFTPLAIPLLTGVSA